MNDPLTALTEKIGLIVPLSEADIALVRSLFKPSLLKKGDYFVQQGQICQQVEFIHRGLPRYFVNQDGDEKIYSFTEVPSSRFGYSVISYIDPRRMIAVSEI